MAQSHPSFTEATPICPSCHCGCGRPNTVTIHQQQRTIRYVCYECLHHWDVTEPDHDFFLWPLPSTAARRPKSH
jgi:hypothetical protein